MYAQLRTVCDGLVVPGLEFERKSPGPVTVNSKTIFDVDLFALQPPPPSTASCGIIYVYIGVHNRIYIYICILDEYRM